MGRGVDDIFIATTKEEAVNWLRDRLSDDYWDSRANDFDWSALAESDYCGSDVWLLEDQPTKRAYLTSKALEAYAYWYPRQPREASAESVQLPCTHYAPADAPCCKDCADLLIDHILDVLAKDVVVI